MLKYHNPDTVAQPTVNYSLGVEVPAGARLLVTAGQIARKPDGTIAEGIEAQVERTLQNLLEVLDAAGMGPENLVKVTTYLVDRAHGSVFREVRDRMIGAPAPAETMIVIAGLARTEMLIEIEAIAAAA
jgi:enamine deaminase RidA (YjgF/YER057c/UK114 family)